MNSEIKRDGEREFLVFRALQEEKWDLFGKEMGIHNRLPALLPLQIRYFNGEEQLFFDITGMISVKDYFLREKIQKKDLVMIFSAMEKAFQGMREYLLEEKNVLILPEYMYIDSVKQQAYLCYYPFFHGFYEENIAQFSEFILEQLDYEDEAATAMAYQFYQGAKQDGLLLGQVLTHIFQKEIESVDQNVDEQEDDYTQKEDFAANYYGQPYVEEGTTPPKTKPAIHLLTKEFLIGLGLSLLSIVVLAIYLGVNFSGRIISSEAVFFSFATYGCGIIFILGIGIMLYLIVTRCIIKNKTM